MLLPLAVLLALDAYLPAEADLLRFPGPCAAVQGARACRQYASFLDGARWLETAEPGRLYRTWYFTLDCRRAWLQLSDCHAKRGWARRLELARLREMLDDDEWEEGRLPWPTP